MENPISANEKALECPVCCQMPREYIVSCTNGHSFCNQCSVKLPLCPICKCTGARIRNRLAEAMLDKIIFCCKWKDKGCEQIIPHSELSAHEQCCPYNTDIISFCSQFRDDDQCPFKFTPAWLMQPKNCNNFLYHVKSCVGSPFIENIEYGKEYTSHITTNMLFSDYPYISSSYKRFIPKFFQLKHNLFDGESETELFFCTRLPQIDESGEQGLAWVFVQLTPETLPVTMTVTLKSSPNSEMELDLGQESIPVLSWTMKPLKFFQFIELVTQPSSECNVCCPFTLPLFNITEHYGDEQGILSETLKIDLIM